MINMADELEYFSYAMPIGPVAEADVEGLVRHFQSRNRRPRLEFCRELWPDVPAQLEAHGFALEIAAPIMLLPRESWLPVEPVIRSRLASGNDAGSLRKVANIAFGMPDDESGDDSSTVSQLDTGELLGALCEIEEQPVGCGYAQGNRLVREIAGIGTLPQFRRRGIASSVITTLLTKFFLDGGKLAWLTPGDDGAEAVYTKLGFKPAATQVNYRLP